MSYKTDLHIHTWYSDGTMSPEAIVEKYYKEEYDLLAVTDHETTEGIKPAQEACKGKNIRVIAGIELSTEYEGTELHILGYYIDPDNSCLKKCLEGLAAARRRRNEKLLKGLEELGAELAEEDLLQRPGQTYIGKPNFARALVAKGYISEEREAFLPGQFLESDKLRAVKKEKLKTEEAIAVIREAGGIAVLAHPCKIKGIGERESDLFKKNFDKLISELKKIGLRGLECIYPKHSEEERLYFITTAGKYHLHITEGTDFHGR